MAEPFQVVLGSIMTSPISVGNHSLPSRLAQPAGWDPPTQTVLFSPDISLKRRQWSALSSPLT